MLAACLLAALLAACGGDGGDDGPPEWALWIYLDGDNDLAAAAHADLTEILGARASPEVAIVFQLDLPGETTRRFRVTPAGFELLEDLGERDMAAAETVTDFLVWAEGAAPARRQALIVWDHGNGWDQADGPRAPVPRAANSLLTEKRGDDGSPFLANQAFRRAVEDAAVRIDLLGFDTSILGTLEALYEFRTLAPVIVTSQEVGSVAGWDYYGLLTTLYGAPALAPEALATVMVETYRDYYEEVLYPPQPGYVQRHGLAAHRSGGLAAIAEAVDGLAGELSAELADPETAAAAAEQLRLARTAAQDIDQEEQPWVYVDLADFDRLLDRPTGISALVEQATIAEYHGRDRPQAHGVSIVFFEPSPKVPDSLALTYDANYRDYDPDTHTGNGGEFLNRFRWDELLDQYYRVVGLL